MGADADSQIVLRMQAFPPMPCLELKSALYDTGMKTESFPYLLIIPSNIEYVSHLEVSECDVDSPSSSGIPLLSSEFP